MAKVGGGSKKTTDNELLAVALSKSGAHIGKVDAVDAPLCTLSDEAAAAAATAAAAN